MRQRTLIAGWFVDYRFRLLALVLALCVPATRGLLELGVDNAVQVWFVEGDAALTRYEAFQRDFGNDEVVVMAVSHPEGILSDAGIERLAAISTAAAATEGVAQVRSLTTVSHVRSGPSVPGEPPALEIGPVVDNDVNSDQLRARVAEDPLLRGTLVSSDLETALVVARMEAGRDMDARRDGILAALDASVAKAAGSRVPSAGIGVIFSALNTASTRDTVVVGGAAYALIVLLLYMLYGRIGPVVVSLTVISLSSILAMGLYGAAGRDVNMVTMALPTLVVIIGIADSVHLLHAVARESGVGRVRNGLAKVWLPCLFTTLTTAAGFAALGTARMGVVRDLGLFAAAGVVAAFVVSLAVVAVAAHWDWALPAERSTGGVRGTVLRLGEWSMANRGTVLLLALLGLLLGARGIAEIEVDTYSIDYFYDDHPVRSDSVEIEESFGNYTPLEFEVRGDVRSADVLGRVARWEDAVVAAERASWSRSLAGVTRRLNQVLTDGEPESFVVPDSDLAVEQALFLYESDPDSDLALLLDDEERRLRVTFGVPMMSAKQVGVAIDAVHAMGKAEGLELEATGYLPLYVTMMDYVVQSQVSSVAVAFVVIFSLLTVLFGSLRLALLAVPANLVPIFMTLGLMGALGIRLDVATVTIAAIVLGLVVDDSLHFLYRYREALRAGCGHEDAVRDSLSHAGVAMMTTTVALSLGFGVLGLAEVKSVAFFGVLSATAMVVALLADVMLLPALIAFSRPNIVSPEGASAE
ncbi:MAG: MMPL family transporter [Proteobacteria bacterium]|nr:MMPL family transporter [Pseudomonadota bacterium]